MFIKYLERVQLGIGVLCLCIFFVAILIQVATRFLGISVVWTGEVANYSFIWAVFMGAAVMLNRREHFKFDLLLKKLKGKVRSSLTLLNDLILLAFSIGILNYGILAVQNFWNYNWTSLSEMKMGYVWISIPIMGGTMAIYLIAHIIHNLRNFNREEAAE
ncbi:TRAP transporter small permease [Thalassobacillus sp. CUG 92003]|uniref:TRAP transporter small permease n=1 Tax=Thalassobacillus sp. CUG 92003 TaxID=2736641 RepID=UPI0015E6E810|nr:TRAP transporter small permease subunit [Thalassobacillus sp. CUG 92003]